VADTRTRVAVKTERSNRITAQEPTRQSSPQGKHQQILAPVLSALITLFVSVCYTTIETAVLVRTVSCET
jgi:hypothetical protein